MNPVPSSNLSPNSSILETKVLAHIVIPATDPAILFFLKKKVRSELQFFF